MPGKIDYPPQQELAGSPAAVSLEHLLEGESLIAFLVRDVRFRKDLIDSMQELSSKAVHAFGAALSELDEVVDKDICGPNWTSERTVGRRSHFLAFRRERGNTDSVEKFEVCSSIFGWTWTR